jgi:hypothetical protein
MATKSKRWSHHVTEKSDALTLEQGVFKQNNPRAIASSLKRSADRSKRRKSEPYRSAMSMLSFYINRAGRNMPARRRRTLEKAKDELRSLYGEQPRAKAARKKRAPAKKTSARKTSTKKRASAKKTSTRKTSARKKTRQPKKRAQRAR